MAALTSGAGERGTARARKHWLPRARRTPVNSSPRVPPTHLRGAAPPAIIGRRDGGSSSTPLAAVGTTRVTIIPAHTAVHHTHAQSAGGHLNHQAAARGGRTAYRAHEGDRYGSGEFVAACTGRHHAPPCKMFGRYLETLPYRPHASPRPSALPMHSGCLASGPWRRGHLQTREEGGRGRGASSTGCGVAGGGGKLHAGAGR